MAVKLNLNDIQFILDQIKIAEAHASGTPLDQLVDSPLLPYGLRTVDGSYNNFGVGREQWGASGEPFPGLAEPNYPTGSGSFGDPRYPSNNDYGQAGNVVDSEPRLISNLIVDQTSTNPAAIYAALQHAGHEGDMFATVRDIRAKFDEIRSTPDWEEDTALRDEYQAYLDTFGIELDGWTIMLPNEAPDDGISASYNALLTFFGQFFDHGLDLVKKGGNGTVYIPLSEDDPLYNAATPHTNFMAVTRATTDEAAAGNVTTPWVDQNQTYTSNASHQIFLREYEDGPDGKPVATGHLLDGVRGLATWADVKAQSYNLLGIDLTDLDVTAVPEMLVDPYGEFIRGDNGLPQILAAFVKKADADGNTYFEPIYVEGDRDNPVDPSAIQLPPGTFIYDPSTGFNRAVVDGETVSAARTGHAFLDDIAHTAVPVKDANGQLVADADSDAGNQVAMDMRGRSTEYDNELLDAHYITGDGRGNENIGLSAVHHIFHSEHNRQVEDIKATIDASGNPALIAQWKLEDGSWDGERLFQAARFATEMQYQHLAFEEFARKIQPDVDIFVVQPDVELNPAILSEFAHVVYRFGHSMLNETVDMIDANGDRTGSMDLFDAFLNPLAFGAVNEDGTVAVNHAQAAGAIIRGMTGQVGNEIDEFVTNTLRNQLLGIPLDLAAINIARGRDTGMLSLNEARAQFMDMADGDTQLKPYENWSDFALNLKNPASIINFIAAYGTHEMLVNATTSEEKRDVAMQLLGLSDPVTTAAADLANASFEGDSLQSGEAGVITDANGNYTTTAPTGWTLTGGAGGVFAPADHIVDSSGLDGGNVAWLRDGAVLSQATGLTLEEGVNYRLTLNVGDRTDMNWPGGRARLVDANGNVLATVELPTPADGTLSTVTFETGVLDATQAGSDLTIEVSHPGGTSDQLLVENIRLDILQPGEITDRLDFLNGTGAWADVETGLNNVDLWVGGLAEKKMSFGGMLGSTFSFVFEMQMEQLQDADRFYYLSRVQGRNLLTELENNSLAKMAQANTDLGDTDFAIPSDIFSAPDHIFYMDHAKQMAMTGKDDPEHEDQALSGFTKLVVRRDSEPVDVEASGLPAGVTFDADARTLAGTVSQAGTYEVTITSIHKNDLTQDHVVQIVAAEATPVDAATLDVLVDDVYYNEANPDVAAAGMDPDVHYAEHGWSEGRSPNAFFDIAYYVAQMPDKDWNGVNPLIHYAEVGWKLGLDPSATFDTDAYLAAHPDVAAAGMNPLAHYLQFGQGEGRAIFDAQPSDAIPVELGQFFSTDLPQNLFVKDGVAEYLRYNGADHIAVGGSDGDDVIIAGDGDDTVWGYDGNDRIEAGYGVDMINGGKGDDIITNSGTDIGETDMFKGDEGNDVIHAGSGLALLFGGEGKDFLMTGPDGGEARGGEDDDFILGGEGQDALFGNGGDDWLEGRARADFIAGDNADIFFNSDIIGHDVLNGGRGDSDYDADSGDDIMVAGEGIEKNIGMWGHDWVTHKGQKVGANADMNFPVFTTLPLEVLRDRFSEVEGLSGWKHDDILRGDDRVTDDSFELESEVEEERPVNEPGEEEDGVVQDEEVIIPGVTVVTQKQEVAPAVYDPTPEGNFVHNELDQAGIDRIAGLDKIITPDMMQAQAYRANGSWERLAEGEQGDIKQVFVGGNILLGGGGSDLIEGRGGDDVIDGDAWLNVRISIRDENGVEIATADGMNARVYSADGAELHRGRPLSALMLERVYNPGQLHIAREILYDDSGTDRAIYWDDLGNYAFDGTSDGRLVVEHVVATEGDAADGNAGDPFDPITGQNRTSDGRDILSNIEELEFRDGVVAIINGNSANNTLNGTAGNDILVGVDGDDIINAGQGNDLLIGGRGNDQLFGGADNDRLIGGAGNDELQGGTGNDTYVMSMAAGADRITEGVGEGAQDRILLQTGGQALDGFSAQDSHGAGGQGDLVIDYKGQKITVVGHYDGVNAQTGVEFINFEGGSIAGHALGGADYRISRADDSDNLRTGTTGNDFIAGESAADILNGNEGNDLLFGGGGNDSLNGGAGNDLLVGGEGSNVLSGGTGDDTMMRGVGDGADQMDGGEGYDTVKVVGDSSAEMYAIYTRDEAVSEGIIDADDTDTEIVITRNGTTIAQMQNVEEIVIDGKGGGDSFTTSGDFSNTALSYSTITLQGSEQGDIIDITGLSSAHRIYFRSGGGNDTIIGTLRPQDVIELPKGARVTDYTVVDNEDGTSTLSDGKGHAVTFTRGDGTPQVSDGNGDAEVPDGSGPDAEEPETGDTGGGQPDQGVETPDAQEPDVEMPEGDTEEDEPETGDSEEGEPVSEAPNEGAEVEEPEQGSDGEDPEVEEPETGEAEGEAPEDEAPEKDTETEAPESEESEVEAPDQDGDESEDEDVERPEAETPEQELEDQEPATDESEAAEDEDDSAQPPAAAIPPATPTERADYILGTAGNDTLVGLHGHDAILAGDGADTLSGGAGDDFLSGEAGRDVLFGGGGNDAMLGGDGADMLYGDAGNDRLLAGADNDLVSGGKGDDMVFGGEGNDTFLAEAGDGNDTYYGDDLEGGYGNDTLDMSAITANITANLGTGVGGRGSVESSQTGRDTLQGVENIITGSGNDDITASRAVNVIDGGDGDDIFRFLSVGDADGDTIMGFQPGDRIDITGIDANALATGNQSFTLVSDGFSGAGELMISEEVREDGTYTILRGNVDDDDEADFEIGVKGSHQFTDSHLNL